MEKKIYITATVFCRVILNKTVLVSNVAVPHPGPAAKCFVKTHDSSILAESKGIRNFLRSLLLFVVDRKLDFLKRHLEVTSLSRSLLLSVN